MNWLLIRGLTREQRHWGRFCEVLKSQSNGTVACLDLPGVGTEIERDSPKRMIEIAEDTRNRWLELRDRHPGPWSFFGISLGAMVGMEWTQAHPDDFKNIVMLNSSAGNLSRPWKRINFKILPKLLLSGAVKDIVAREKRILKMTTNMLSEPELDRVAQEWASVAGDSKRLRNAFRRQIPAAIHFHAPAKLSLPVLVLTSSKDNFTDPTCSYELARHFNAPLSCHPEAGHDVSLDDPDWVVKQIAEWKNSKV